MKVLFFVFGLLYMVSGVPIKFEARCDDHEILTRSDDGGATWNQLLTSSSWTDLQSHTYQVTCNTLFRLSCRNGGGPGGVIAEITYDGTAYPTTSPLTAGKWSYYSGAFTSYQGKSGTPWPTLDTTMFDASAYWLMVGEYQTVTLEFAMSDVCDECKAFGLQTLGTPHACACQSSCGGSYCNPFTFVEGKLNENSGKTDADLCPAGEACCCSCPNCGAGYIGPQIY